MAVVRITEALKATVCNNARNKFSDRIREAEQSVPNDEHWGDFIYETILGKYLPIMKQLPAEFFEKVTALSVKRICGDTAHINYRLSSAKPWPAALPADAPLEHMLYSNNLALNSDPVWTELREAVAAWRLRCSTIRTQAQEFTEGVSKVLGSYSTLAPALKAWPPLWDLLPEHVKDKHKEIVERTRSEREIPSLDTDKLTAIMAASRLLR
jgi:hypothetical protein